MTDDFAFKPNLVPLRRTTLPILRGAQAVSPSAEGERSIDRGGKRFTAAKTREVETHPHADTSNVISVIPQKFPWLKRK